MPKANPHWAGVKGKQCQEALTRPIRVRTIEKDPETKQNKWIDKKTTLIDLAISNVKRALLERYPPGHELAGMMTPTAFGMTNSVLNRAWGRPKETKEISVNGGVLVAQLDAEHARLLAAQVQREMLDEVSERAELDRGGDHSGGAVRQLAEVGGERSGHQDADGEPETGTGDGGDAEPAEWDEGSDEPSGGDGADEDEE